MAGASLSAATGALKARLAEAEARLGPQQEQVRAREADLAEEFATDLHSLGLELVRRGPTQVSLLALPLLLDAGELHQLLGKLVGVERIERVLVLQLRRQQR